MKTSARNAVVVRSPQAADLVDVLRREGATVEALEPGFVSVVGLDAARIGDLAFEASIRLHELSPGGDPGGGVPGGHADAEE